MRPPILSNQGAQGAQGAQSTPLLTLTLLSLALGACAESPISNTPIGGSSTPVVMRAMCGDGLLASASEECDDGNTDDGDGCSAFCRIELIEAGVSAGTEPPMGGVMGGVMAGTEPPVGGVTGGVMAGTEPPVGGVMGGVMAGTEPPVGGVMGGVMAGAQAGAEPPVGGVMGGATPPVGGSMPPEGGAMGGAEPPAGGATPPVCQDDPYEDNDAIGAAAPLAPAQGISLAICGGDEDFYAIQGCPGGVLQVQMTQGAGTGDLDVRLTRRDGFRLGASNTPNPVESVRYVFADASVAYLHIYGYQGGAGAYTLNVSLEGCVPPPACMVNADCGVAELCVGGACVPQPECAVSTDCPAGEVCQGGACVPLPPECAVNTDCAGGRVCDAGRCLFPPQQCATSANCAANEVCQGGACVPVAPECVVNADCGVGELCSQGSCVPNPLFCATSLDCAPGEVCAFGACVPEPVGCVSDLSCAGDLVCRGGLCVPPPPECVLAEDCGSNRSCVNSACVDLPAVNTCTVTSNCNPHQVCTSGRCVYEADRAEGNPANNTRASSANWLTPNLYSYFTITSGDQDWIGFDICAGGEIDVEIRFSDDRGDLDLKLFDANDRLLESSTSVTDHERVKYTSPTAQRVYAQIYGYSSSTNIYDLYLRTSGCDGVAADRLEDNDMPYASLPVTTGDYLDLTVTSADWDWYAVDLCAGAELSVGVFFTDSVGDIDVKAYSSSGAQVAAATSGTDDELLTYTSPVEQTIYYRVFGFSGAQNTYDMMVDVANCGAYERDRLEENDTLATAEILRPNLYSNLTISTETDEDWIGVDVCAGGTVEVEIRFDGGAGDLDLLLYDAQANELDVSAGVLDSEIVSYTSASAARVYAQVVGFAGAMNRYDLYVRVRGCP